ncbi:hypothetical protein MRX96_046860 [Rhipicephalus microplus]
MYDARIFVDSTEVTIVGFFKNQTSLEAKEFLKAAYTIDRHAFAITSEDVMANEGSDVFQEGQCCTVEFDERRNTLALKPTCDKIRTFVAVNSQPLVVVLTAQISVEVEVRLAGVVWVVFVTGDGEVALVESLEHPLFAQLTSGGV